ncbi:MAG: hypothetical protein QG596_1441 [Actinomycetota bacterium]|jgi:hypothetical protein|nr:hypothetical protein [Actinomycetota bacterium]
MAAELPFIDQHHIDSPAVPEQLWSSLISTFGSSEKGIFTAYAKVIGAEANHASGDLDQTGSTRVGFRVSSVEPPFRLLLTGRHRFSEYSLEWKITGHDGGSSSLTAVTRARFPGVHGRAYKALVIDSGAHSRITRRMLSSVAHRATPSI